LLITSIKLLPDFICACAVQRERKRGSLLEDCIFSKRVVLSRVQVGENGSGKTTLLKILNGALEPTRGIRHAHQNLKIGYFTQHHVDQLDMGMTSVELLASRYPGEQSICKCLPCDCDKRFC